MATLHLERKLTGWWVAVLIGIVGVASGECAVAQQPVVTSPSSEKMILALTKIPTTPPGKGSKLRVKRPLVTVTGPTSVVIVSMSMFGAGTHVERDDKGAPVLASQAEFGLGIKDSSGDYRIEADKRTKIAAELVDKEMVITNTGRMVLHINPGIVLRVTGVLRGSSIEATSIDAAESGATAGPAAEPR